MRGVLRTEDTKNSRMNQVSYPNNNLKFQQMSNILDNADTRGCFSTLVSLVNTPEVVLHQWFKCLLTINLKRLRRSANSDIQKLEDLLNPMGRMS